MAALTPCLAQAYRALSRHQSEKENMNTVNTVTIPNYTVHDLGHGYQIDVIVVAAEIKWRYSISPVNFTAAFGSPASPRIARQSKVFLLATLGLLQWNFKV